MNANGSLQIGKHLIQWLRANTMAGKLVLAQEMGD